MEYKDEEARSNMSVKQRMDLESDLHVGNWNHN